MTQKEIYFELLQEMCDNPSESIDETLERVAQIRELCPHQLIVVDEDDNGNPIYSLVFEDGSEIRDALSYPRRFDYEPLIH